MQQLCQFFCMDAPHELWQNASRKSYMETAQKCKELYWTNPESNTPWNCGVRQRSGQTVLPFFTWLHSEVILFLPHVVLLMQLLERDGPKRIIQKKIAIDRRRRRFFYFSFISWVQQPFNGWGNFPLIQLKWINLPGKVFKNTLIVSWYICVLIGCFKGLTTC